MYASDGLVCPPLGRRRFSFDSPFLVGFFGS